MPIYEFYCSRCHRILSFLSRSVNTDKRPACPRCGQAELPRRASTFAISRGRKEAPAGAPDVDESRLEQAMASLARDAEGLDESDPRQAARLMRRLFEAGGLPTTGGMEEALRRMEAGEDPDKIEAEMGDVFDAGPPGEAAEPHAAGGGIRAAARRLLPPSVDPELYEL